MSTFLEGWKLQRASNIAEAVQCYKDAVDDKCAIFHWNCMDRYGQSIPLNLNNRMRFKNFTLTVEEFECLYNCYKDIEEVEIKFNLGKLYEVSKNIEQAKRCFQEAIDYPPAQDNLGHLFEKEKNYPEAIRWYTFAAHNGDSRAQYNLGSIYEKGKIIPQNYEEAIKYHQMSVANNNPHRGAQFRLGILHYYGHGVIEDHTKAIEFMRLSADQGCSMAQDLLGWVYEIGDGVPQNYEEAFKWYHLAADKGVVFSYIHLGQLYEYGKGVPKNYEEAAKWYQLASESGSTNHNLGFLYIAGKGVPQNYQKAYTHLLPLANKGNRCALYNIGYLYHHGLGVPQSYNEAVNFYQKASVKGYAKATHYLNEILQLEIDIYQHLLLYTSTHNNNIVFEDFLTDLKQKFGFADWTDLLVQSWITKAWVSYFGTSNSEINNWLQNYTLRKKK